MKNKKRVIKSSVHDVEELNVRVSRVDVEFNGKECRDAVKLSLFEFCGEDDDHCWDGHFLSNRDAQKIARMLNAITVPKPSTKEDSFTTAKRFVEAGAMVPCDVARDLLEDLGMVVGIVNIDKG